MGGHDLRREPMPVDATVTYIQHPRFARPAQELFDTPDTEFDLPATQAGH